MRREDNMHRTQRGFTLLEVLMAVALSAMVVTSIAVLYDAVADSSSGAEREIDLNQEGRILAGVLMDDLKGVVMKDKNSSFTFLLSDTSTAFEEDPFLQFATTTTLYNCESPPCQGFKRIQYYLSEDDNGETFTLYREEHPYCDLSGEWEGEKIRLLSGLSEFSVQLRDSTASDYVSEVSLDTLEKAELYTSIQISYSISEQGNQRDYALTLPFVPAKGGV